jgi:hypothetical protein
MHQVPLVFSTISTHDPERSRARSARSLSKTLACRLSMAGRGRYCNRRWSSVDRSNRERRRCEETCGDRTAVNVQSKVVSAGSRLVLPALTVLVIAVAIVGGLFVGVHFGR